MSLLKFLGDLWWLRLVVVHNPQYLIQSYVDWDLVESSALVPGFATFSACLKWTNTKCQKHPHAPWMLSFWRDEGYPRLKCLMVSMLHRHLHLSKLWRNGVFHSHSYTRETVPHWKANSLFPVWSLGKGCNLLKKLYYSLVGRTEIISLCSNWSLLVF